MAKLKSLTFNGNILVDFVTKDEADKFSLSMSFPAWLREETEGKGKNKVVTGIIPTAFTKRSVNSLHRYLDPRMDQFPDMLEDATDSDLPGFRGFLRKNGITETIVQGPIQTVLDANGEITGYNGLDSVKQIIVLVTKIMEDLSPVAGSVADPSLEAKRIFSKSDPYKNLAYEDHKAKMLQWKKVQLDNIERVMDKAEDLTAEDYKIFCETKFTDNGVDEDGFVRLKAERTTKTPAK